jgi:nucleotide-binding universal stress UspA family protein
MRIAPVPVLAVNRHTSESPEVTKVLCPVTFTPASRDALRYAAGLAGSDDVSLVVVRGVDEDNIPIGTQERKRLESWLPPNLHARCELQLIGGPDPAEQIVQVAKRMKIDLIAIGIPAGRSIADSIRGTIAERVLQRSECPVLAVNAYAARVLPARVVTEGELVTAG